MADEKGQAGKADGLSAREVIYGVLDKLRDDMVRAGVAQDPGRFSVACAYWNRIAQYLIRCSTRDEMVQRARRFDTEARDICSSPDNPVEDKILGAHRSICARLVLDAFSEKLEPWLEKWLLRAAGLECRRMDDELATLKKLEVIRVSGGIER